MIDSTANKTLDVPRDFVRQIVAEDLASGKHARSVTRFPPEPNGYLHVGHAKSICLNFGIAQDFSGDCHMRFDDTNPEKEEQDYVDSILRDVQWLGFQWVGPVRYASDYFDTLHDLALQLIRADKAFVCDLNAEQMREYRGTLTQPGRNSPFRERSVEENLDLFARMCAGEFAEGGKTLRAKIDMGSANINLRDPVLYRIRHAEHHQTGNKWCIYPSYDYTHPISDALEGISHSICTLEFEDHKPLYDWLIDTLIGLGALSARPRQYEFARLNLNYTVTSKRKLKQLVDEKQVNGWDDPRMPTIAGMRRRGYAAAAIREFCKRIGVTRAEGIVDMGMLEFCVREELELSAPRAMAVLRPLKVVLTNYAESARQVLTAVRHPNVPELGERSIPFTHELYIDHEDFAEVPPKGWKRLVPGGEVRLRNAYVMRCDDVIKDAEGNITELRCSIDRETLGKNPEDRKVKGVIHWVSASESVACEVRVYDRLFTEANPDAGDGGFLACLNPLSLQTLTAARVEPSLAGAAVGDRFQFEREGYFCVDSDSRSGALVFNRIVALRDSWAGGK